MSLNSVLQQILSIGYAPQQATAPTPVAPVPQGVAPVPQMMDAASNQPLAPPVAQGAPAQAPNRSILGAIGRMIFPEAGSLLHGAFNHGAANARQAQEEYPQEQATRSALNELAVAKAARDVNKPVVAGNNLVITGPDGQPQFITPPAQPTEQERIIERWLKASDGGKNPNSPLAKMIERAVKGFQYSDEYLDDKGAAAAKYRAPPRASGGGGVSATARAKYVSEAQAAIDSGADPAKVKARLAKMGISF